MFKTISAALLAASVFVAPAMADTSRTDQAPAAKTATVNSKVLNANAKAKAKTKSHHRHHSAPKQS